MRRLIGLLLPALLAVALLLPATAAHAAPAPQLDGPVLAAEVDPDAPPPGREPMDANNTENPAAPDDYEPPFVWAASVGLLALAIFGVLALAGLYYLLVHRPQQQATGRR